MPSCYSYLISVGLSLTYYFLFSETNCNAYFWILLPLYPCLSCLLFGFLPNVEDKRIEEIINQLMIAAAAAEIIDKIMRVKE